MIRLLFVTSILCMQTLSMAQDKPTLIYIGDPMCSWCYGFAPELSKAAEQLEDKVNMKLVLGGLRPYNDEHIDGMKAFLKEHWDHVHEASNQPFDFAILDDPDFIYDTEPPSRAVLVVRHLQPVSELAFFKDVQTLFYAKNTHTDKAENYHELLDKYSINKEAFDKAFHSDDMKALIRKDFEESQEMGIRGFPSMVLVQNGKLTLISNGYTQADNVVNKVLSAIK